MPSPDPDFARVAKSLPVFVLTAEGPEDKARHVPGTHHDRFLDFYTLDGIRLAMHAYGIDEKQREMGLDDIQLEVSRDDPFHHRLQVFTGPGRDDEDRTLDLRIHLQRVRVDAGGEDPAVFDAMAVEWIALQNPRGTFTRAYPRLPGQRLPGTHLGRTMHNLLLIMATRIGRDALVGTPAKWHLARLYQRAGYRFADQGKNLEVEEVAVATRNLRFAAAAWAVERGCVRNRATGEPYRYEPADMILPLSPELKLRLKLAKQALRQLLVRVQPASYEVDLDALRTSLREDPVEGMDPEDLERSWF